VLAGPVTRAGYRGYTRANNHVEGIQEHYSEMAFASVDAKIESPPGNGPYCFHAHSHSSHLFSYETTNKPGEGQLYIL
jgi:hypothetical protein